MNELLIALVTSVDIFAAVMGLSCSGIKLPKASAAAVAFVGAAVLCAAAAISEAASVIFGKYGVTGGGFISKALLLVLGIKTITDGIRSSRPAGGSPCKKSGILDIAGAPEKADCDRSAEISLAEAVLLGAALSADSVFTGLSAGIRGLSPLLIFPLSLTAGLCACAFGQLAGRLVRRGIKEKFPAGIITGIGLIFIALLL